MMLLYQRSLQLLSLTIPVLLSCLLSAVMSCAPPPEERVVAKVGNREITAGQVRAFSESLPQAARQGMETQEALLEALILQRLLLLEAETQGIERLPEFAEEFSGFGERELGEAYIRLKVSADLDGRQRAERMKALTDSLWLDHRGEIHRGAVQLVSEWLAAGRPQLETAILDRHIGVYESGQLTTRKFIATAAAGGKAVTRRLSSPAAIASLARSLIVGKIVFWEAKSLGLHEAPNYVAMVDAERDKLLVRLTLRKFAGTAGQGGYEAFVAGLREQYGVEIPTRDPPE